MMRSFIRALVAVPLLYSISGNTETLFALQEEENLEQWLTTESIHALQSIFDNIGPNGAYAQTAHAGIVIASPSRSDPDYYFTWIRDSALVFKNIVDSFVAGSYDLQGRIHEYITSQAYLQTVPNRSGDLSTGGIGEPKFYVNQTAFLGDWGRPQTDGPALRIAAMAAYGKWLIRNGHQNVARLIVWPVISNDLAYVGEHWNTSGFDLWEEHKGPSFFTTIAQYRALIEGGDLARRLGTTCPQCSSQSPQVLCLLQSFWNGTNIIANPGAKRTGLDANSILGTIHNFDPEAKCDDATFQPCSSKALANHKRVTDSFRSIYPINAGIPENQAVAVGRYPEDVYFGGQPWYIATFAAAELLYDAIYQWKRIHSITITTVSLPFFQSIYEQAKIGTYSSSTSTFSDIISRVQRYADGYVEIGRKYTPCSGSLSEQYSRVNGAQVSARDLTWSFSALLTAKKRRDSVVPDSWGQGAPRDIPSTCSATSASGSYRTATITDWPSSLTPTPTSPAPCPIPTAVKVTFQSVSGTEWGENIFIVGSIPELGSWNPDDAIPLKADKYANSCHLWYTELEFVPGTKFEYKFIRKDNGHVAWETGPNRSYLIPACGVSSLVLKSSWR